MCPRRRAVQSRLTCTCVRASEIDDAALHAVAVVRLKLWLSFACFGGFHFGRVLVPAVGCQEVHAAEGRQHTAHAAPACCTAPHSEYRVLPL